MKNILIRQRLAIWSLVSAVLLGLLFGFSDPLEARSSFWISSRDSNACIISAVLQYDVKEETRVRTENGITNAVILMDIHTKEPQELCSMLIIRQGSLRWRPLICVTGIRGNIYSGYLILPPEFTLTKPIEIKLGQRSLKAQFIE